MIAHDAKPHDRRINNAIKNAHHLNIASSLSAALLFEVLLSQPNGDKQRSFFSTQFPIRLNRRNFIIHLTVSPAASGHGRMHLKEMRCSHGCSLNKNRHGLNASLCWLLVQLALHQSMNNVEFNPMSWL